MKKGFTALERLAYRGGAALNKTGGAFKSGRESGRRAHRGARQRGARRRASMLSGAPVSVPVLGLLYFSAKKGTGTEAGAPDR
jgi:hypothetical protein